MKREVLSFDDDALQALQRYHWPGNVRELENIVARAVVLCKGRHIGVNDLPPKLLESARDFEPATTWQPISLREALEEPEQRILEAALRANGWNRQLTADQLGINRTTLYKKMKRYGLDAEPVQAG